MSILDNVLGGLHLVGNRTPKTEGASESGRKGHVDPEPRGLSTSYIENGGSSLPDDLNGVADDWQAAGDKVVEILSDFQSNDLSSAMSGWLGDAPDQMRLGVSGFVTSGSSLQKIAHEMASHIRLTGADLNNSKMQIGAVSKTAGNGPTSTLGATLHGMLQFSGLGLLTTTATDEKQKNKELNAVVQRVHNPAISKIPDQVLGVVSLKDPVGGSPGPGGGGLGAGGGGGGGSGSGGGAPTGPSGVNVPKPNLKPTVPSKGTPSPGNGGPSGAPNTPSPSQPGSGEKGNKAGAPGVPLTPHGPGNKGKKGLKTNLAGAGMGGGGKGAGGKGGGLGAAANAAKAARTAAAQEAKLASSMRGVGQGGVKGSSGGPMMGRGAGASKSADGKEHKSAEYLVTQENTEELLGEAPLAAPPVIKE